MKYILAILVVSTQYLFAETKSENATINIIDLTGVVRMDGLKLSPNLSLERKFGQSSWISFDEESAGRVTLQACESDILIKEWTVEVNEERVEIGPPTAGLISNKKGSVTFLARSEEAPTPGGDPNTEPSTGGQYSRVKKKYEIIFQRPVPEDPLEGEDDESSKGGAVFSSAGCCSTNPSSVAGVTQISDAQNPTGYSSYEAITAGAHFEIPLGGVQSGGDVLSLGAIVFKSGLVGSTFPVNWHQALVYDDVINLSHLLSVSDPLSDTERGIYSTAKYVLETREDAGSVFIRQYPASAIEDVIDNQTSGLVPILTYKISRVTPTSGEPYFQFERFENNSPTPVQSEKYFETVASGSSSVEWELNNGKRLEVQTKQVQPIYSSQTGSPLPRSLITTIRESYEIKEGRKQLVGYTRTEHEIFRYTTTGEYHIKLNHAVSGVGQTRQRREYTYGSGVGAFDVIKTYRAADTSSEYLADVTARQNNSSHHVSPWLSVDITNWMGARLAKNDAGELIHFAPGTVSGQDSRFWPATTGLTKFYAEEVEENEMNLLSVESGPITGVGVARTTAMKTILGMPSGYAKVGLSRYYMGGALYGSSYLTPSDSKEGSVPFAVPTAGPLFQSFQLSGNATEYSQESVFTPQPAEAAAYPQSGAPYKVSYSIDDLYAPLSFSHDAVGVQGPLKKPFKTTRTITVRGKHGVASEIQQVWVEGEDEAPDEWMELSKTYYTYSSDGKLLTVIKGGVEIERHTYPDEFTHHMTDSQGVTTILVTDEDGQLVSSTRQGASATSEWPAQPDVETSFNAEVYPVSTNPNSAITAQDLSETTTAGALSLTRSRREDLGGTTLFETDETGMTTTYTKALFSGFVRDMVSRASGDYTLTTSRHLDGRLQSKAGSGQAAKEYTYAVTPNGIVETETMTGVTPEITNIRTFSGAGDLLSETVDGVTTTYAYDLAGQLISKSVSGRANYLYKYDYRGFAEMEGYDVSGDGLLTAGSTDVITERARFYEIDEGAWWLVNQVSRYVTDDNGTQKLTTTTREKQDISEGWVTQTISPDGEREETSRIRSGKTVTSTTTSTRYPGRFQTQVLYNGRLVSSQSFSQSQPVTYLYDALGRQTTVTDQGTGESQTTAYSPTTGQVISQTNGAAETTSYGYYAATDTNAGQLNWVQNSAGLRTYYAYNTLGLQTYQWGAAAQPLRYDYDEAGRLNYLHTYNSNDPGPWSGPDQPAFGLGDSRTFTMTNNRLSSRTYGLGAGGVSYAYLSDGGVYTRTWEGTGGGTAEYGYDPAGRITGIQHYTGTPNNKIPDGSTPDVIATYDRAGRLATLTDAVGGHTFAHEANGDVVETVTGGLLNGLKLKKTLDESGQVATIQWSFEGVSQKASYIYDSQKRLENVSLAPVTGVDPPVVGATLVAATYGYHSGSQRVHTLTRPIATGDNFVGTSTQDVVGRLDTLIWQRGSTVHGSYDYDLDAAGRRDKETRHDGTWLDYGYNDRGELTSAARKRTSDNSTRQDWSYLYTYDNAGNPKTTVMPEGQTLLHAQLDSGSNYNRTLTPAQKRWLRGVAHPNAVVTVGGQTATREGPLWRYLLVNPAPPAAQRTTLVASRPDRSPEPVPVTQTITLPASPSTWVFNVRGNLTSDAQWIYTWDMENRLIVQEQKFPGITGDGPQPVKRLEFSYDVKGRRIAKRVLTNQRRSNGSLVNGSWSFAEETVFLWQDWTLLAEFLRSSPSGSFRLRRSYLWGLDVDGTFGGAGGVGGLLWVAEYVPGQSTSHRQLAPWYDGNGNIMGWLEKDGGQSLPLYRLEYDPYGKLLVEETVRVERNQKQRDLNVGAEWLTRPPFAFSTKYEDAETGLLYYGYRYYAPEMGRWISRDPIGERGGINLYGMVGNDPVNYFDVLGLMTYAEFAAAVDASATPEDLFKAFGGAGENNYLLTCHCGIIDVRHVALAIEGVTTGPTRPPGRQRLPPMTPEEYMNFAFDRETGHVPWGSSTPEQRANTMSNFNPNEKGGRTTEDHPSDALGALAGSGGKWKEDLKKIVNSCSVVSQKIDDAFTVKYGPKWRYILAAPLNPFAAPHLIDDKLRSLGECCPERKPGETPQDYFNRSGLRFNPSPSQNMNGRNTPTGPGTINWPK